MLDLKSSGTTAAELPRTTAFTNLSMLFAGTFDVPDVSRSSPAIAALPFPLSRCCASILRLDREADNSRLHAALMSHLHPRCRSRAPCVPVASTLLLEYRPFRGLARAFENLSVHRTERFVPRSCTLHKNARSRLHERVRVRLIARTGSFGRSCGSKRERERERRRMRDPEYVSRVL